ncbi:MAG: MXAN_5187 C-terminal domain-containing protein [Desulfuromonadales bacterium]
MDDRNDIARELGNIEQQMKELEIVYEQYFAGVEKREPVKMRQDLTIRLRRFTNRRIIQSNLRFRYQNLATRFHSYSGHWDRILRLMDEGRYVRHTSTAAKAPSAAASPTNEVDAVHRDLLRAHQSSNLQGPGPEREKVAHFLEQQREKIREKFGDRAVEFRVEMDGGKPKIKVRAKS